MNPGQFLLVWKVAILRVFLYSVVVACTAYQGATIDKFWGDMNGGEHTSVILTVFIQWATVIIAYLDKAEKKLESNGLPPDDDQQTVKPPPTAAQPKEP